MGVCCGSSKSTKAGGKKTETRKPAPAKPVSTTVEAKQDVVEENPAAGEEVVDQVEDVVEDVVEDRTEPCPAVEAEVIPDGFTDQISYTIVGFNDSADPGWGIANIDWIRENKHVLYDGGMVD